MKTKYYSFLLIFVLQTLVAQNIQQKSSYRGWDDPELKKDYQDDLFKNRNSTSGSKYIVADNVKRKKASGVKLSEEELAFLEEMNELEARNNAYIEKEIKKSIAQYPLLLEKNLKKIKVLIKNQNEKYNHLLLKNILLLGIIIALISLFFKKSTKST